MAVPNRGLHLYPSKYYQSGNQYWPKFQRDDQILSTITGLNSVKTTLFSYMDQGSSRTFWLNQQRQKLSDIVSHVGTGATYVFRCWPDAGDGLGTLSYGDAGIQFAQNLADAFYHIQFDLGLPNVIMEVANEPNNPSEPFGQNSGNYNNFLNGFHSGQQNVGYNWPLAYAGLSPALAYNPNSWYTDYWVQYHIRNFCSKVGVHIYYDNGNRNLVFSNPPGQGTDPTSAPQGAYYQWIRNALAGAGIPRLGLVITEANTPRDQWPSDIAQLQDMCSWWQQVYADAAQYWTEQALLYVTDSDDFNDQRLYQLTDAQVNSGIIQNCG